MADDESKSTFTLDLDNSSFLEGAKQSLDAINSIGKSGGIESLVSGLEEGLGEIALIAVALEGMKKAFEIAFDADHIRAVNAQFDAFAVNAGVVPEKLKQGLEDASHGWVDNTTLMSAANKAMSQLTVGTEKLPEVMDLARRATATMGGDFVENFESMTQAIANGNVKALAHLGLKIDLNKAYRDYASSIGVTVDVLSQEGQQQARLNALLDLGKTKFQSNTEALTETTNTWKVFKATLSEVSEVLTILFDRVLGPILRTTFTMMNKSLSDVKNSLLATFGIGAEKVEGMTGKLKTLTEELEQAKKAQAAATDFSSAQQAANRVTALTNQIKNYNDELNKVKTTDKAYLAQQQQQAAQEEAIGNQKVQHHSVDLDKKAKKEAEYAKEVENLKKQVLDEEMKSMTTIDQANSIFQQKEKMELAQIDAQRMALIAKHRQALISENAFKEQMAQLDHLRTLKAEHDTAQQEAMQKQALDNYVRQSNNAFEGISRSFHAHAMKAEMDLKNWGMLGDTVFDSMSNNAVAGFEAIGSGAQSAGDAMKGFMFNSLAEIAEAEGKLLLATALLNPANAVAGAALLVLAGFLKSQAGAAGAKGGGSIGGGGSGGSTGGAATPSAGSVGGGQPLPSQAAANTSNGNGMTQIVVQGSIFDSAATQTRMADLVRAASDGTGFSIQRIGGGV